MFKSTVIPGAASKMAIPSIWKDAGKQTSHLSTRFTPLRGRSRAKLRVGSRGLASRADNTTTNRHFHALQHYAFASDSLPFRPSLFFEPARGKVRPPSGTLMSSLGVVVMAVTNS
jgi:hypothetical protein